ncbi:lipoprotein [Advenella faeciporci]|uniref:Lipoprotein n=1 Tax=Advenella faeciporci TaxID=797535 RepID=A0A918MYZ0_9BURK|nr:tripartite tricarboxylate transporter substrate binding protein [Advenella faeciporci]GGW83377.1 lipoprotein [Advenella faeciporci]
MKFTKKMAVLAFGITLFSHSASVFARNDSITVVVPYSSGSVLDTAMRVVAEEYNKLFNELIIIENKPGAGGAIAAQHVARAQPNGKTILMGSSGMLSINPYTFDKLPYSADKDFKAITGFVAAPMLMAINKEVPATNVKEFVEWINSHPDQANYGSFSTGNPSHFAGFILNKATGIQLVNIPYTGGSRYVQDLVGGRLTSLFAQRLNLEAFYKEGLLKIIATSGENRDSALPDVATFKEQGLPDLTFMMWTALLVPANTDDMVIKQLSQRFNEAMSQPAITQRLKDIDFQSIASSPEKTNEFILSESKRWGAIVKETGFKVN